MGITIDSIIEHFNKSVASKRNGVEEILTQPELKKFIQENKTALLHDLTELLVFFRTQYYAPINQFSRSRQDIDIPLFTAISQDDFKQALQSEELEPKDRPYTNYNRYDDDLTIVSAYVQFDILKNTGHLQRLLAITRWILCAKDLVESYNFHSSPGIIKGLLNVKVTRTVNMRDLPVEVNAVFERIQLLLSNYKLLSSLFFNSEKPIIPCHTILFRKATKIEVQIKHWARLKKERQTKMDALSLLFNTVQRLDAEEENVVTSDVENGKLSPDILQELQYPFDVDENEFGSELLQTDDTPSRVENKSSSKPPQEDEYLSEIEKNLTECDQELDLYNKRFQELLDRIEYLKNNLTNQSSASINGNLVNMQQGSQTHKALKEVLRLFQTDIKSVDKEYFANRFYKSLSKIREPKKLLQLVADFKNELMFEINSPIESKQIEQVQSQPRLLAFLDKLKISLEDLITSLKNTEAKETKKTIHDFKTQILKELSPIMKQFKREFHKAHADFLVKREDTYHYNRTLFPLCAQAVQDHFQKPKIGLLDDALYQLSYIITRPNPKKEGRYLEGSPRITPAEYGRHDSDPAKLREICEMLELLPQFNSTKIDEIIAMSISPSSQESLSQESSSSIESLSSQGTSPSQEIPSSQQTLFSRKISSSPETNTKGSRIQTLTSTTYHSLRHTTGKVTVRVYGQLHGLFKNPEEKDTQEENTKVVINPLIPLLPLKTKTAHNPIYRKSFFVTPRTTLEQEPDSSSSSIESESTPRYDV